LVIRVRLSHIAVNVYFFQAQVHVQLLLLLSLRAEVHCQVVAIVDIAGLHDQLTLNIE